MKSYRKKARKEQFKIKRILSKTAAWEEKQFKHFSPEGFEMLHKIRARSIDRSKPIQEEMRELATLDEKVSKFPPEERRFLHGVIASQRINAVAFETEKTLDAAIEEHKKTPPALRASFLKKIRQEALSATMKTVEHFSGYPTTAWKKWENQLVDTSRIELEIQNAERQAKLEVKQLARQARAVQKTRQAETAQKTGIIAPRVERVAKPLFHSPEFDKIDEQIRRETNEVLSNDVMRRHLSEAFLKSRQPKMRLEQFIKTPAAWNTGDLSLLNRVARIHKLLEKKAKHVNE